MEQQPITLPAESPTGRPELPQWIIAPAATAVIVAGALEFAFPPEHVVSVACRVVLALGAALGIYSQGKRRASSQVCTPKEIANGTCKPH